MPVTGELLLERVQTLAGAFDSLQGMARVRIDTGGKSVSGTQVLLAQKPDLLRAETLNPFGSPVLLVTADGRQLSVMIPGEGRFLRGEATYGNLRRFTRLPLQLSDLVHLLLYQVPVIPHQQARVAATDEGYLLTLTGAETVRQELLFDPELRLVRSSYFQGEDLVLQVGYSRFEAGTPPFPHTMSLDMPGQQTQASLTFTEVTLNRPIPPERFTLTPPAGYKVEELR